MSFDAPTHPELAWGYEFNFRGGVDSEDVRDVPQNFLVHSLLRGGIPIIPKLERPSRPYFQLQFSGIRQFMTGKRGQKWQPSSPHSMGLCYLVN
jgi:hypothetical protein